MTKPYTVESITEGFPNPSIPRIEGEPSFQSIKEIEKLLIENAASVSSELGGGNRRYLGLVLSPAKHNTVTGVNFEPHLNPRALPVFPEHLTQPQIAQANATYKDRLSLWREQEVAIKALKNKLTGAAESKFLADLQDTCTRYNRK